MWNLWTIQNVYRDQARTNSERRIHERHCRTMVTVTATLFCFIFNVFIIDSNYCSSPFVRVVISTYAYDGRWLPMPWARARNTHPLHTFIYECPTIHRNHNY